MHRQRWNVSLPEDLSDRNGGWPWIASWKCTSALDFQTHVHVVRIESILMRSKSRFKLCLCHDLKNSPQTHGPFQYTSLIIHCPSQDPRISLDTSLSLSSLSLPTTKKWTHDFLNNSQTGMFLSISTVATLASPSSYTRITRISSHSVFLFYT